MSTVSLKNWNLELGKKGEIFGFLGVNVMDDPGQVTEVAQELKQITQDLEIPFVFKASVDKANRSSVSSYRGMGFDKGLKALLDIKAKVGVPVITDIHESYQAEFVQDVDIIQIPAFLNRQTDLLLASVKVADKNNGLIHVKKSQFQAPWDCKTIVEKIKSIAPGKQMTILCERGTSFGYNRLVCDMMSIIEMQKMDVPVSIDSSHAAQRPGTTGNDDFSEDVKVLSRAGIVSGADGIFLEFHPSPREAKCDNKTCLALSDARALLTELKQLKSIVK